MVEIDSVVEAQCYEVRSDLRRGGAESTSSNSWTLASSCRCRNSR